MFSFGFYNSKDGDRKYNATHFSKMFDGIIQDGVFGTIGSMFKVEPASGEGNELKVILNPGKAWFMHTWNILDAQTVLTFNPVANTQKKRTDAICIQVNNNYDEESYTSRTNKIVIIEGVDVPATGNNNPPDLKQVWNANNSERRIWQYPLAYVTIYGGSHNGGTTETAFDANKINSNNIENRVNPINESIENKYITWTPLVTGAMMDIKLEDYLPNYSNLLNELMAYEEAKFNAWFEEISRSMVGEFTEFYGETFQDFITYYEYDEETGKYFRTEDTEPEEGKIYYTFSTAESVTSLHNKIDNKYKYGTSSTPPADLEVGQVYFQLED